MMSEDPRKRSGDITTAGLIALGMIIVGVVALAWIIVNGLG